MGRNLGADKKFNPRRYPNVDPVDITPPPRRPTDDPMLESTNTTRIRLHANIRSMENIFNVNKSALVHWFFVH